MTENASFIGAIDSSTFCDEDDDIRDIGMTPGCGIGPVGGRLSGNGFEEGIPDIGMVCE